ncbi:TPA: hypothetical protein PJ704_001303 [Staphylococcus aureus]|nr:hypothetical protein [Staphylococcus aureus]
MLGAWLTRSWYFLSAKYKPPTNVKITANFFIIQTPF